MKKIFVTTMPIKIFLLAILTVLVVPTFHVHGAPLYQVSPLVIDTSVEARDIIKKTITLTNTGTQPVTIYPTVNNISLKDGGTIDEFLAPVQSDRTKSLASWIEISRLGIDLKPGTSKTIDLTLRINPDALPGSYHAFIGFGYGGNRDEAERQVQGGQAPGTVVTVTIEEKKNEFLKLSKFIIDRFVTNANNQAAAYTFKNPGDETLVPKGEIIFYDTSGEEVGSVEVNKDNVSIPPGGEHVFVETVPTDGLFGKYKAFLSVEYGTSQKASVQDTSFFYVFPIKAIGILLIILVSIVGIFAWHFHKKYLDEDIDDSDRLMLHIRDTQSEAKDHDVNLKKQS